MIRRSNIVNDESNENYVVGNKIIYNAEVLKSNLCDYNNAYILVRDDIITTKQNNSTPFLFKNYAPLSKCMTKIDGITIDYAEDLDLVIPMYNVIEYSSNYSDTTGRSWYDTKDVATNFDFDIAKNVFKSFKYKDKLLESTVVDGNNSILNAVIAVPLKYLSFFGDYRKCHWLIANLNRNLNGQRIRQSPRKRRKSMIE